MKKGFYIILLVLLSGNYVFSQQKISDLKIAQDSIIVLDNDPLKPSKAAFYSAILPGLGQIYNKDYWKVPIVYIAIGASTYYYIHSNNQYHRYRDAYKRRLAGFNDDEFQGDRFLDNQRLLDAQKGFQRNRDLSMLLTVGFYILNIVEANVAAHLKQFNVSENLSLSPEWYRDDLNYGQNLGLTLKYEF